MTEPAPAATIADILGIPARTTCSRLDCVDRNARFVPFVEPKRPDWDRVGQICSLSARAARWANFGPVSEALGRVIELLTDLPSDYCVVPTASGTAALHAVAGMHAVTAGRPLTWAISAFGFHASAIGPLSDRVHVVDCDSSGLLDLEQLERADAGCWDGMIVTNVFGIASSFDRFAEFSRRTGKPLVIDSALAFPLPRHHTQGADEIISFHHTKPWGFGEGGCAIVPRHNAAIVRALINFGVGLDSMAATYAMNGKLADAAAALIIDRLERMSSWAPLYALQRERIVTAIEDVGLEMLGRAPADTIVAHQAVLAPRPLALDAVPKTPFAVGRYYRPLRPNFPNATELFSRIINIPCHSAMAAVAGQELRAFLSRLSGGAKVGERS